MSDEATSPSKNNCSFSSFIRDLEIGKQLWSKIAQHLPGRTDNEIKNYWRTRVQKHAKQLKCDVNSKQFKDVMYHLWIPRLLERIQTNSTVPEPVNGQHEQSPGCSSSDSVVTRSSSPLTSDCFPVEGFNVVGGASTGGDQIHEAEYRSLAGYSDRGLLDFEEWDMGGNLWNVEDIWF
ncbi:uncharacterized protein A4U43_C08F32490 [Asparagus officinalis]|nr:uncharacterized protein A4U43_C08F32490 [Asparagus officinalis]